MARKTKPEKAQKRRKAAPQASPVTVGAPSVDLLPKSYRESVQLRKVRAQGTALGVAVVLAIGGLYLGQQGLIFKANRDLDQAKNESSVIAKETEKYMPARIYLSQIASNAAQISTNMSKEATTSAVLDAFAQVGQGVNLTSVDIAIDTVVGGTQNSVAPATTPTDVFEGCPQINLFKKDTAPAVGCVKITGEVPNRDVLAAWLEAVEGNPMFVSPFVSGTTAVEGQIQFSASVGLTTKSYSFRYSPEFVLGETSGGN